MTHLLSQVKLVQSCSGSRLIFFPGLKFSTTGAGGFEEHCCLEFLPFEDWSGVLPALYPKCSCPQSRREMPKRQGAENLSDTYRCALPPPQKRGSLQDSHPQSHPQPSLATRIAASHEALTAPLRDHCGAGRERVKKATHGDRGKIRRLEKEMATHSSILAWKTVHGVAKSWTQLSD